MSIPPRDEAAAIFTRLFEALARTNGKTLSQRSRADIARACELLTQAAGDLDELLDDLPTPRQSPGERAAALDPGYARWRAQRAVEHDG